MGYALVFQIPCPDRCLDPVQTPPEKAFRGSKYSQGILEDFGSLMMLVPWRKYIAVFVTWNVLRSKTGDEHSSQLCGGIPAFSRLEFDSSPCILWPLGSVGRLYIYNIYIYILLIYYMNCKHVLLKWTVSKDLFSFQTIIFQERCQLLGVHVYLHVSDLYG